MIDLAPELIALLLGVAVVAGFVDSIAGGGGLLTLPVLLLAGLSPAQALATNKIQSAFGAATAAANYARKGHVNIRRQLGPALLAFLAGLAGAVLVSQLPTGWLRIVLPVLLIAIAIFFAVKPGLDDMPRARILSPARVTWLVIPAVAFYDGLIGPGAGAFYMLAFVTLAGMGMLSATAATKFLNLASNLGGLAGFVITGHPAWALGLGMGVAQIVGATAGSHLASQMGARLIKPLLVVTSTALALRLLWEHVG